MHKKELQRILKQHKLWLESEKKEGERADLRGANLTGVVLDEADLWGAHLRYANLTGANLTGSMLSRACMRGANLSKANLSSSMMFEVDLRKANLTGAVLDGAKFWYADLREAIVKPCSATGCHITDAKFSSAKDKAWMMLLGAVDEK